MLKLGYLRQCALVEGLRRLSREVYCVGNILRRGLFVWCLCCMGKPSWKVQFLGRGMKLVPSCIAAAQHLSHCGRQFDIVVGHMNFNEVCPHVSQCKLW